ncbi:MAG: helix-turn-helix transcriptional regulator, partial [Burkholderiales bacterium PBB5]
ARLRGVLGAPGFAQAARHSLNAGALQAGSWSVYQLRPGAEPVLHLSASVGVADTTRDCFGAYRDGLYRHDRSFDAVAPGAAAVLRMHADEAPSSAHRERIYRRHGVLERLSAVQRHADGGVLAVNLYHHTHQGRFGEGELAGFAELAPLLLAAVQRQIALMPAVAGASGPADTPDPTPRPGAGDARQALRQHCAALTERELDVCERLLRGWSHDGIAADLGLTVATVKTYKARAFARLGLHFRSQLFAALRPH